MKIVCLGDSLTYGYKLRRQEVWTYLLEEKYGVKVINKGINGDSTFGMVSRFYRDVIENKPSHVIIIGGANDLIQGVSVNNVQSNIATLVYQSMHFNIVPILGIQLIGQAETAKEHFPFVEDFCKANEDLLKLRKWIISFGKGYNLPIIDFSKEIIKCTTKDNIDEFYFDGLHLTPKGNKKMAEIVADILELKR